MSVDFTLAFDRGSFFGARLPAARDQRLQPQCGEHPDRKLGPRARAVRLDDPTDYIERILLLDGDLGAGQRARRSRTPQPHRVRLRRRLPGGPDGPAGRARGGGARCRGPGGLVVITSFTGRLCLPLEFPSRADPPRTGGHARCRPSRRSSAACRRPRWIRWADLRPFSLAWRRSALRATPTKARSAGEHPAPLRLGRDRGAGGDGAAAAAQVLAR